MDKILLWQNKKIASASPSITPYLLSGSRPCPAVLIIPGGGYGNVCESTEGMPIAQKFNALGFHAFVLDYRVAPHRYPAPQEDALRAMKMIRGNAGLWKVIPDRITACGFSAGGHLACCLGTIFAEIDANDGDEFDSISGIPDALILGYAVISLETWSNQDTGNNLLADELVKNTRKYSLQYRVNAKTPPVFLWHTVEDQIVPFQNGIVFVEAMQKFNRPCELHLFPYGKHGMLLGLKTHDVAQWPELAVNFLKTQWDLQQRQKYYTNEAQSILQ